MSVPESLECVLKPHQQIQPQFSQQVNTRRYSGPEELSISIACQELCSIGCFHIGAV